MPGMMRKTFVLVVALVMSACSFGGSGNKGGGGGGGGGDDVDASIPVCGDGVCAATEVGSCTQDCGGGGTNPVCGNGQCESSKGESASSCPSDCGGGGGAVCGNSICEASETGTSCPSDCAGGGSGSLDCNDQNVLLACVTCLLTNQCSGVDPNSCQACIGGGGMGAGCTGGIPDGVCDANEDSTSCPFDCM
jgi:hypothetical protein